MAMNKEDYMKTVNKDMIIADILQIDIGIAQILMAAGMNCVGCPAAKGETLEEASIVHGMDVGKLVDDINAFLEGK